MDVLKVVEQTGPHYTKSATPKRYYSLVFSDARKTNYFPKDVNEVPNLKGLDVDVELEANGQYWNLKSLTIHGAAHAHVDDSMSVKPAAMNSVAIKMQCVQVAATLNNDVASVLNTAEQLYQFIIK